MVPAQACPPPCTRTGATIWCVRLVVVGDWEPCGTVLQVVQRSAAVVGVAGVCRGGVCRMVHPCMGHLNRSYTWDWSKESGAVLLAPWLGEC
jgi:hypothetical protein